ncbi:hypothetical protein LCM17_02410 [Cereibacter sphaeroides]|nr:hypothetical protein [Cereibacter sphaeroides]
MRQAPLVYLDTQDFIRFRDNRNDASVAAQYAELKSLRRSGRIRLGYSALNIWEFITPARKAEFVQDRTERGELVVDLCGLNAFPFYSDLATGAHYPNNGLWMPAGLLSKAQDFDKILKEKIKDFLAAKGIAANRDFRRKLKSPSFLRSLRHEFSGHEDSSLPVSSDINPMIGLIIGKYFEGYLLGKISSRMLNRKLVGWASDPRSFGSLWHEFGGGVSALDEFVYKYLIKIIEIIEEVILRLDEISEIKKKLQGERSKIMADMVRAGFDRRLAKSLLPRMPVVEDDFQFAPGEFNLDAFGDGRLEHVVHYANKRIARVGRTQRSDVVDMMHMLYAYDCDYFRCDKAMFNLFADFPPFSGKLVASIPDLLDRIR